MRKDKDVSNTEILVEICAHREKKKNQERLIYFWGVDVMGNVAAVADVFTLCSITPVFICDLMLIWLLGRWFIYV